MAILSAGINFGKPQTEFIVESDENGVIQSCRNVVTGVEYAGGGGGGDFTTAEVSCVASGDINVSFDAPIIDNNDDFLMGSYSFITDSFTVVLYKGALEAYLWDNGNNSPVPAENISVTGDIEVDDDGVVIISGDGSITITE